MEKDWIGLICVYHSVLLVEICSNLDAIHDSTVQYSTIHDSIVQYMTVHDST